MIEMIRCLLSDARLAKLLWSEAIITANFQLNRLPINAYPIEKTPFEIWHGTNPADMSINLRVFGCPVREEE